MSKKKVRIAETIETENVGGRTIQLQREVGDTYRVVVSHRPNPVGPLRVERERRGLPIRHLAYLLFCRCVREERQELEERKA